jgi:signal transduction histidine kinase/ActR/RegA family two-component response regulator
MSSEEEKWRRRLDREKNARKQAESLLEQKSLELWDANEALRKFSDDLQHKVDKRSVDLAQALEKEVEANKAKSEFVSMISHEMRTPLNAIIGFSEILADPERAANLGAQQHKDYIGNISTASRGLLSLINDILDLAKIEAGKLELEIIDFNHAELVRQLFDTYKITAKGKPVEVILNVDPNIPDFLRGDPNRLSQVINNLFSNALKFTESGQVELSVKELEAKDANAHRIEYCVRDSGIGMSQEVMEKLFQPFVQADNSMSRKFGGTGLGLNISKQLSAAMGGKIWAESEHGKGSSFYFIVQYDAADMGSAANTVAKAKEEDRLEGFTILLVEDDLINQELAKYLIETEGAELDIASNGLEAVDAVQSKNYDLVLMDLQMPICDGYTATLKIRNELNNTNLTIIAMTANAASDVKARCMEVGMNDFLTKPFIIEDLLQTIEKYCDKPKPEKQTFAPELGLSGLGELEAPEQKLVDVDTALAALHGNRRLYGRILTQFSNCCDEGVYALDYKRIQSDKTNSLRLIYTVKRLALNIGAFYISDLLTQLEQAIERGDESTVETLVESYSYGLEYVAREIEQIDVSEL